MVLRDKLVGWCAVVYPKPEGLFLLLHNSWWCMRLGCSSLGDGVFVHTGRREPGCRNRCVAVMESLCLCLLESFVVDLVVSVSL